MAFALNKNEILKDIIEVKKTSTGETYTNVKINIGSVIYKINEQTDALDTKLAEIRAEQLIKKSHTLDIAQEIKCEKTAKIKINSGTAVAGLMLLDASNIKYIEELIIKTQKKGSDKLKKPITEWVSLHSNIIMNNIHISYVNDLIAQINSWILCAITKFEKLAYSYKEDTLSEIFWELGSLVDSYRNLYGYINKYERVLLNYKSTSMSDEEIQHTNKVLNSEWFTDIIDTYESGYYDLRGTTLKIGKSLDFPTKQRYVILSIIEDVWRTESAINTTELEIYTSKLKSIALKFKEVHGQIERDLSSVEDKKVLKLVTHQYYFEVPTDRLNTVTMIRNLIYSNLIIKYRLEIEKHKEKLDIQLKYI